MKEKLEKIEGFIQLLKVGRKTGTITFDSIEQKLELKKVYESIYNVTAQISCDSCVRFYLEQLEAFYDREKLKFDNQNEKEIQKITFENVIQPKETIASKSKKKIKK